jgi:hypothetical protein
LAFCRVEVEKGADVETDEAVMEAGAEAGASSRRCEGLARHLQQFVLAIWLPSKSLATSLRT